MDAGLSIKVGCRASFSAGVVTGEEYTPTSDPEGPPPPPGIVRITFIQPAHVTKAGCAVLACTAHRLSADCKSWVANRLFEAGGSINDSQLVLQNRGRLASTYHLAGRDASKVAAALQAHHPQAFRDYQLNDKDVRCGERLLGVTFAELLPARRRTQYSPWAPPPTRTQEHPHPPRRGGVESRRRAGRERAQAARGRARNFPHLAGAGRGSNCGRHPRAGRSRGGRQRPGLHGGLADHVAAPADTGVWRQSAIDAGHHVHHQRAQGELPVPLATYDLVCGALSSAAVLPTQYPLTTLLAIDDHSNGYPVAFLVSEDTKAPTLAAFLRAVVDKARATMPEWCPSCIFIDCDDAEIRAIRCALGGAAPCCCCCCSAPVDFAD